MKIGIVIDPVHNIKPKKDSSLALMLAAQADGAEIFVVQQDDLFTENGCAYGHMQKIEVFDREQDWCRLDDKKTVKLACLDMLFMRKDPPVDKRFIHTTYVLDQAAAEGVSVVNPPHTLRDFNEKIFAAHFPEFSPPYTIGADFGIFKEFLDLHGKIIMKPLDGMGGDGVFMIEKGDVNFDVIWETLTQRGRYPVIAQRFIEDISAGDKRIIVIDGEAFPHMLVRLPAKGSIRGNLAVSGAYDVRRLSEKDHAISEAVGKKLKSENILFAGIDIIGEYLTEVNITSPTGLREIARESGADPAVLLWQKAVALRLRDCDNTPRDTTSRTVA